MLNRSFSFLPSYSDTADSAEQTHCLRRQYRCVLTITLLLFAGCWSSVGAGTLLFQESFLNSSAPGWTLTGNAALTGGSLDPNGQGWLRLTNSLSNQSSFAFETTDLPFLHGVDIKLSFATWGGSGADGFAVSLINGSQNIIQPGGYGGSLGYAQRNSPAPQPGLLGGILGIGVDEFGNFSTPGEGRVGGTSAQPNSIAIRGPGDGTANATTTNGQPNYGYLTAGTVAHPLQTGADGTTTRPSNVYQADLTIGTQLIAQGHLPITVTLTDANGAQTVINSYDAYNALVAYYGGAANIPQTMDIGFSGGTGSLTNVHEIRDLTISSVDDISGPSDVPEPPLRSLVLIALAMIVFGSTWSRKILAKAKQTADYL